MVETFEKLKSAASRLNATSDSVNASLKKIEENLKALNLGLEVWLDGDELKSFNQNPILKENIDGDETKIGEEWTETQLGWAETAGGWGLTLRDVDYRTEPDRYGNQGTGISMIYSVRPLLSASRALRIEAAGVIEKLYVQLLEAAEEKIKKAENAKQVASQL